MSDVEQRVTRKVSNELADLQSKENPSLKDVISAILSSTNLLSSKFDSICNKVIKLESDNDLNKKRIKKLEFNVDTMRKTQNDISSKIDFFEQSQLNKDVVISGLPINTNQTDSVIKKLAEILSFEQSDILFAALRKPAEKLHPDPDQNQREPVCQIIIRFKQHEGKQHVMKNMRKNGPIFLKQLFPGNKQIQSTMSKVYLNDRLTHTNYELMKEARKLKVNKKITSIYLNNSRVVVKVLPDSRPTTVHSIQDVRALEDKITKKSSQK